MSADSRKISMLFLTGDEANLLGTCVETIMSQLKDHDEIPRDEYRETVSELQSLFIRLSWIEGSGLYDASFCDVCEGQFEDVRDGLCSKCDVRVDEVEHGGES
jgi:hypothetical protein